MLTAMRLSSVAWLLSLAWLQPAPAEAQFFLGFDETPLCFTGCGVYMSESPGGVMVHGWDAECPPGRAPCLVATHSEDFQARINYDVGVGESNSIYFEAMVRHAGGGEENRLLFFAKRDGDHEVLMQIGAAGTLRLDLLDLAATTSSYVELNSGTVFVPPGVWARVALRATVEDFGFLHYQVWVDDALVAEDTTPYPFDNPEFLQYWSGAYFSAGTDLRLDDICIGHGEDLREGFCTEERSGPTADGGVPPLEDASVPDAAPPREDSAVPTDGATDSASGDSSAAPDGSSLFRGAGGCTCDAAGSPSPLGAGASLAVLVLLFAFRRRR